MPGRGTLNRSVHYPLRPSGTSPKFHNYSKHNYFYLPCGIWGRTGGGQSGCPALAVDGSYATILEMKAKIPQPVHESYLKHRRELVWQIILPVALMSILIVALIVLINIATFNQGGDVARWAAISTIWIVIPIMLAGLVLVAVLIALVYGLKRLLEITPTYTGLAQDYVHLAAGYVRRAADMIVRPVLFLDSIGASFRRLLGRN